MARDNSGAVHISAAIQELLKAQHLKPKFDEASVIAAWERLVGKAVAKRTRRIYIRDKVLFIELLSPTMKHDLGYHKQAMLEIVEKEFGAGIIREIILM